MKRLSALALVAGLVTGAAAGVETRAVYRPWITYAETDAERADPIYQPASTLIPAPLDPIAGKPVVVGLAHPSGAVVYAGAETADAAADALAKVYERIKPLLPPTPATTTTTTTDVFPPT
jgi:hypothetical protein